MSPQPISSIYIITMFGFLGSFADAFPSVTKKDSTTKNIILNDFCLNGVQFLENQGSAEKPVLALDVAKSVNGWK